jgi:hypothetical protein
MKERKTLNVFEGTPQMVGLRIAVQHVKQYQPYNEKLVIITSTECHLLHYRLSGRGQRSCPFKQRPKVTGLCNGARLCSDTINTAQFQVMLSHK